MVVDMEAHRDYVPLAWYNNGCYGHTAALHTPSRKTFSPPPPYMERDPRIELQHVHPALRYHRSEKQIIYASVRPSLPRLRTTSLDPSPPASPTSQRSSLASQPSYSNSVSSDTSSIHSDSSSPSSPTSLYAPRSLRRSKRRARGMSLRELRQKQSEANLQRACTSSVDDYLSGNLFENFRISSEPVIMESCGEAFG